MEIETNSKVEIITKDKTYDGILIESHDSKIVLLKLESGYNIGINKDSILKIKKISDAKKETKLKEINQNEKLPKIAIVATGGTLACKVDYATGGVSAIETPSDLLRRFDDLKSIVNFEVHIPYTLDDSSQVSSVEWKKLSKLVSSLLNKKEIKGVIVLQGTDTLHYTSAALSFMLNNLNKPVVLTYSQRSIDRGSSDAFLNLKCACYAALSDIAEVMVVGHETTNDDSCLAIRGTKVRKMHSSKRNAFKAINEDPLARIFSDGRIEVLNHKHKKRRDNKIEVKSYFEDRTALIKFFPNASSSIIDHFVKEKYKGIVIEAVGLGQLNDSWIHSIKEAISKNIFVGISSQTIYGRVNPYVYSPARKLEKLGAIFLKDMLSETAYIKLGWLLGQDIGIERVKHKMLENISNEFNDRL